MSKSDMTLKFAEISQAYAVLSSPILRKEYDMELARIADPHHKEWTHRHSQAQYHDYESLRRSFYQRNQKRMRENYGTTAEDFWSRYYQDKDQDNVQAAKDAAGFKNKYEFSFKTFMVYGNIVKFVLLAFGIMYASSIFVPKAFFDDPGFKNFVREEESQRKWEKSDRAES